MHIEVSEGEAIDKLTILAIKRAKLADPVQRANVEQDLQQLGDLVASTGLLDDPVIRTEADTLSAINRQLWDVEEHLRTKESLQRFDDEFVQLARSVYVMNDARAAAKRRINQRAGSRLVEEKSYRSSSSAMSTAVHARTMLSSNSGDASEK
jgi:Family of unknown function (DUF6165)